MVECYNKYFSTIIGAPWKEGRVRLRLTNTFWLSFLSITQFWEIVKVFAVKNLYSSVTPLLFK